MRAVDIDELNNKIDSYVDAESLLLFKLWSNDEK